MINVHVPSLLSGVYITVIPWLMQSSAEPGQIAVTVLFAGIGVAVAWVWSRA